ncbi:hypothetical protein J2Z40_000196 [Cytobacillus eiseniae]|uniref:Uncharacterized protein n=1 Tax=Cytobacillus eiseniae TaxID=762947 RepID=A0ABS4R9S0_9BACI|nr:hypothetical protein [Cytobacillus eiseniae]MBP2239643.1 hypothetical protein [Cytobacillus eiseniae]
MYRNKNKGIILLLCAILIIFLVVSAFRNISVYVVYSSGIGTFIIIGLLIMAIIFVYLKGL